ncbi:hypothetical protein HDU98_009851 [Podochytrium sp. JEL0797]|nr:hypothetical protein HDU98_009851 [Podochytrium sp. JEL0797]
MIPLMSRLCEEWRQRYNAKDKRNQRLRNLPSGSGSNAEGLMRNPEEFGGSSELGFHVDKKYLNDKLDEFYDGPHLLFPQPILDTFRTIRFEMPGRGSIDSILDVWPVLQYMVREIRQRGIEQQIVAYQEESMDTAEVADVESENWWQIRRV